MGCKREGICAPRSATAEIFLTSVLGRGCVFTPILEGFFTQYGDVPLDLFCPEADMLLAQGMPPSVHVRDPDIVLKQHAELGNVEAMKELRRKDEERAKAIREEKGDSC